MSAHTPGPWQMRIDRTAAEWPVIYVRNRRYEDGVQDIAELATISSDGQRDPDADEIEANARLIAVAPEMLDQLKLVAQAIHEGHSVSLVRLEALIAKAEGK